MAMARAAAKARAISERCGQNAALPSRWSVYWNVASGDRMAISPTMA